jgi:hypothetical protein
LGPDDVAEMARAALLDLRTYAQPHDGGNP